MEDRYRAATMRVRERCAFDALPHSRGTMPTAPLRLVGTSTRNTVALLSLPSQGVRVAAAIAVCLIATRSMPVARCAALHFGYWDYMAGSILLRTRVNDRQSRLAALNLNNTRYTPSGLCRGGRLWSSAGV